MGALTRCTRLWENVSIRAKDVVDNLIFGVNSHFLKQELTRSSQAMQVKVARNDIACNLTWVSVICK